MENSTQGVTNNQKKSHKVISLKQYLLSKVDAELDNKKVSSKGNKIVSKWKYLR